MKSILSKLFQLSPIKIGLTINILMILIVIWNPGFIETLEAQLTDVRFKIRGYIEPGPEVAIVAIDEKSVDAFGQWPLPRKAMAQLVEKLTELGVITIGFDIVFAETGTSIKTEAANLIKEASNELGENQEKFNGLINLIEKKQTPNEYFAEALTNSEAGIMGFFFHDNLDNLKHLSSEEIKSNMAEIEPTSYKNPDIAPGSDLQFLLNFEGVEKSLELLTKSSQGGGFLNIEPDGDGTLRRFPLVVKADKFYYAPLFLQSLAHYLEEPPPTFKADDFGVHEMRIGEMQIPVDLKAKFLVNYYGPGKTFPHYSIIDIIEGKVPVEKLDSRLVLIGATGKGLTDLRPTPYERLFPGVEIHATIIDNILHSKYLVEPIWYQSLTMALIFAIGLIFALVLPRIRNLYGIILAVSCLGGYLFFTQYMFNKGVLINIIYPSLQIVVVFASLKAYDYFKESRKTQFIQNAFGQYLSPVIIKKLIQNPDNLSLGGSEQRLTAFFSDVAAFSSFSEKMTPPELVELLNEYLTAMSEIIIRHDGTIDKYEGDAIIAFYGAPVENPKHALNACLASLEMHEKLVEMRADWLERGKPEVQVRMGLNTGQMVVGNMGSTMRMDYTIMGDAVNLASRLEGVNKIYGTQLMVSEFTQGDIAEDLETRELDQIRVVGKNEPIKIYEVLAKKGELSAERTKAMAQFAVGLGIYRQKDFEKAEDKFNEVLGILPDDGPSLTYIKRCADYKDNPPPEDWDGVYQMTSK